MADSVKSSYSASFDITFQDTGDGNPQKTRSLTADFINVGSLSEARARAITFGQSLDTIYSDLIQPSNWRDDDVSENAYVIESVASKVVYKQEIMIDPA